MYQSYQWSPSFYASGRSTPYVYLPVSHMSSPTQLMYLLSGIWHRSRAHYRKRPCAAGSAQMKKKLLLENWDLIHIDTLCGGRLPWPPGASGDDDK